jgi:hypothetical protein
MEPPSAVANTTLQSPTSVVPVALLPSESPSSFSVASTAKTSFNLMGALELGIRRRQEDQQQQPTTPLSKRQKKDQNHMSSHVA